MVTAYFDAVGQNDVVYLTSKLSWRVIQTQKAAPTKLIATIAIIAVVFIVLIF